MEIDTQLLIITAENLRPASPDEQARFGFAPCQAADLSLPGWWGELELWVGEHQDVTIPLLVHERVAPQMMTEHQVVDLAGTLVSVTGQLRTGERTARYSPAWFQVETVSRSEMKRVWVEHMVMIHGGLRNGLVPVRFGISPAPLWVRATALPPPPGTPAAMRAKLMINRFIRSGLELQSLFLFGYLAPIGEELPDPQAPKKKTAKKAVAKKTPAKKAAAKKAAAKKASDEGSSVGETTDDNSEGKTPSSDDALAVEASEVPADMVIAEPGLTPGVEAVTPPTAEEPSVSHSESPGQEATPGADVI